MTTPTEADRTPSSEKAGEKMIGSSAIERTSHGPEDTAGERFWTRDNLCGLINYAWSMQRLHPWIQPRQANDVLFDFVDTLKQEERVEQEG
jgi:hypothetical protein